jgi:hypothetical protein
VAETLGSLYDKLSIAKIRLETLYGRISAGVPVTQAEELSTLAFLVRRQVADLEKEIVEYKTQAFNGTITKLEEPKYKIYQGENPSLVKFDDVADAAFHLGKVNKTLWDLEDGRRDKSKGDAEVRQICDDVAKYNRLRNDMMDEINRLFKEQVLSGKNQ